MADELDCWTVVEAKTRWSELLARAEQVGPQRVTRHGRDCAVVVGAGDWARGGRRRPIAAVLAGKGRGFSVQDDYLAMLLPRLAEQAPKAAERAAERS